VTQSKAPRASYHHGDLANALTDAATELARQGGPEAVVLREAARMVGVSATAAYRHFAGHGDLIHAVKERAQVFLAASMQDEVNASAAAAGNEPPAGAAVPQPPGTTPGDACTALGPGDARTALGKDATRRLRALGRGYVRFALGEPGLFRTAFCRSDSGHDENEAGMLSSPAFQMLSTTLDDLVAAGLLDPERRPYGETTAWSVGHGLAMLLLDGPLNRMPEEARGPMIDGTLDTIVDALTRMGGTQVR
jgi:AcrR family transcriptional regulator